MDWVERAEEESDSHYRLNSQYPHGVQRTLFAARVFVIKKTFNIVSTNGITASGTLWPNIRKATTAIGIVNNVAIILQTVLPVRCATQLNTVGNDRNKINTVPNNASSRGEEGPRKSLRATAW